MRRMRLFKFVGKVLPLAALIVGVVWAALHDQKYINPAAPAVRREAEEDWCSKKTRVTKQRCVVLLRRWVITATTVAPNLLGMSALPQSKLMQRAKRSPHMSERACRVAAPMSAFGTKRTSEPC